MSSRFILPFADVGSGIKPSSGAQLFFFAKGTSTPKDTFSDQLSTPTPNANPVIADSKGVFGDIFITGTYKVTLKDKNGVQIWEADPVDELGIGALISDLSQAYEFPTVAAYKAFTTAFPAGKVVHLLDRDAEFTVIAGTGTANGLNVIASDQVSFSINEVFEKSNITSKPIKIKPSISEFISNALTETAHTQIKLGDGRLSPGTTITDLVYRTAHNSSGGTDGSFKIISRFAVPVTDIVNAVVFTIQVDPALVGGLLVRGIATSDNDLNTVSISYFTLVDNGSGNFSFNFSPTGAKDFYGFECELTPVDATNDATLHDEFFVIQDMTIVQNSVDLMSQTEALTGSTWAQQVLTALPLAFSTQTLPSLATNDVFITHTQLISGASYRYAYASPTGLATNDGSEFSEFNLEFAANLVSAGALGLLFLKAGTYSYSGVNPRDIFTIATSSQRVLCADPLGAVIDTSFALPFGSMSPVSSHFEISYSEVNHFNAATIGVGTATPKIIMDTLTKNFTEVFTSGEVDGLDYSFFWDNSAKKFLLRFDGTLTDSVHVPESGNLFIGENIGYFGAANIKMKGVQAAILNINGGDFYETFSTGTLFGNAAGDIYNIDDIDGQQIDDSLIKCQADGYNYHGSGHTDIFDCSGTYCKDDGLSHHDDCTGYLLRGNYDNNGKGGVIPAFGAYVECVNVSATGNKLGDSPLAQAGTFGGFVCLSNDADTDETTLICYDCTGDDNKYNFLSSGGKSNMVIYRADNVSSVSEDFASLTWNSNTVGGRLDVIQAAGDYAFIVGQESIIKTMI